MSRIEVDRDRCASTGGCEALAPDVFEVDDDGIVFAHDYQFPHVLLGAQPDGRFPVAWSEIAPFLDPASPLQRLAKP